MVVVKSEGLVIGHPRPEWHDESLMVMISPVPINFSETPSARMEVVREKEKARCGVDAQITASAVFRHKSKGTWG